MNEPRLSYLIGRLDRILRRQLSATVEANGLTLPAYTTLSVLRADNGLSNAQLARRSMVTPQSMSEVLAYLVNRGFVRRRAEPGHGRIVRTEITPAGADALARCDEAVDEIEGSMLADLRLDEIEAFRDLLRRSSLALVDERTGQTSA